MRLDSAREIKLALRHQLVQASLEVAHGVSRGAEPARPSQEIGRRRPSIALGITTATGDGYRLAVRVQRHDLEGSSQIQRISDRANGEVEVRYIGRVLKRAAAPWHQSRCRPIVIGTSIGHFSITAGTLGCFVTRRKGDGRVMALSNNHVLADENRAHSGDAVIQPAHSDGGRRNKDVIGTLAELVLLRSGLPNKVDVALSSINSSIVYRPSSLRGVGQLKGVVTEPPGRMEQVEKLGRTTGHTRGRVTAFEVDNVIVEYDMGYLRFDNQLEIEGADSVAFSDGGDSGALIYTSSDWLGRGVLFAGSDQGGSNGKGVTFANPLQAALDALSVRLSL